MRLKGGVGFQKNLLVHCGSDRTQCKPHKLVPM